MKVVNEYTKYKQTTLNKNINNKLKNSLLTETMNKHYTNNRNSFVHKFITIEC